MCEIQQLRFRIDQSLKEHQKFQGLGTGKFKFIDYTSHAHQLARKEAEVYH